MIFSVNRCLLTYVIMGDFFSINTYMLIRVSQTIGINVQTSQLMLATSFSGYVYPKDVGKPKKMKIF